MEALNGGWPIESIYCIDADGEYLDLMYPDAFYGVTWRIFWLGNIPESNPNLIDNEDE